LTDYDKKENAKRLREGLKNHILFVADKGRAKYGDISSLSTLQKFLQDPDVVRYATTLVFDADKLAKGTLLSLKPAGEDGEEFCIYLHPLLQKREHDAIQVALSSVVSINYGKIAKEYEAELFASQMLGITEEDYHSRMESLKDELSNYS
jgi:hypothetical protein